MGRPPPNQFLQDVSWDMWKWKWKMGKRVSDCRHWHLICAID
jgi:hypothetical protein